MLKQYLNKAGILLTSRVICCCKHHAVCLPVNALLAWEATTEVSVMYAIASVVQHPIYIQFLLSWSSNIKLLSNCKYDLCILHASNKTEENLCGSQISDQKLLVHCSIEFSFQIMWVKKLHIFCS